MVSIPSWQRVRGQLNFVKKESKGTNIGKNANDFREEEIIKEAEAKGYFLIPTKEFLITQFSEVADSEDGNVKLINDNSNKISAIKNKLKTTKQDDLLTNIRSVKLYGIRLRAIGDLGLLTNLRICILANNFIDNVKGLENCQQLLKLDLSSNLIHNIPATHFWSNFKSLRILHLHDNPIGSISLANSLAILDYLTILTLYDTPLSLKKNYRHHFVNIIWSLKALDHHVISDEEIIEDARFGGRFSMFSEGFRMNLYSNKLENVSYEQEMSSISSIIQKVNKRIAHYSPVVILQRMIRGYLLRKKLNKKTRLPKISLSKQTENVQQMQQLIGGTNIDTTRVDYDTYLANRRPGSGTNPQTVRIPSAASIQEDVNNSALRSGAISVNYVNTRSKSDLNIANSQLDSGGLLAMISSKNDEIDFFLKDEPIIVFTTPRAKSKRLQQKPHYNNQDNNQQNLINQRNNTDNSILLHKRLSVRRFFGPVVDPPNSPEPENNDNEAFIESSANFRLRGFPPPANKLHPVAQHFLDKRNAGMDIRNCLTKLHENLSQQQKPKIQRKEKNVLSSADCFKKAFQDASISCLRAVHTAYQDRKKAEKLTEKYEKVLKIRESKQLAKHNIKVMQEKKRNNTIIWRENEIKNMQESLNRQNLQKQKALKHAATHHTKSTAVSRYMHRERTFVTDFAAQNTSVSNALLKHDSTNSKCGILSEKTEIVSTQKQKAEEKSNLIHNYFEHRQLSLQNQSVMERAKIDAKTFQDANNRLIEARNRVEKLKSRRENITDVLPIAKAKLTVDSDIKKPLNAHKSLIMPTA